MIWLLACRSGPPAVVAVGTPAPLVESVVLVQVEGPPGTAVVEYGLDGAFDLATPEMGVGERAPVLGLKSGQDYDLRGVVIDEQGERHESAPFLFRVPEAPPGLVRPSVSVSEPESELGFFLANVIVQDETYETSFAAILDRDGDWVWWVNTNGDLIVTPELAPDGRSVLWSSYAFDKTVDAGTLVRQSIDGTTRTETRLALGHHDFVVHDDGSVAFLSAEFEQVEFNGETYPLMTDRISLTEEGSASEAPAVLFSMLEDFPLVPEPTCSHITSVEPRLGMAAVADWTHGNSLAWVPEADAYYLNQKFTDWLLKIDRPTGALQWILNGRGSTFTQPSGDPVWNDIDQTTLWSHAHLSEVWDGGAMVFDNGDHHDPPLSRALEVAWDEEAGTAEVVWEFPHPEGLQTSALGDVRRLDQNVLVTWSGLGGVTEVTREGRIVWGATFPAPGIVGRLVPVRDLYGR